jgi:hypothetical protein
LPLFHYKLARLWSDTARARMVSQAGSYFPRTEQNVRAIFGSDDFQTGLSRLNGHLRPARDAVSGLLRP